eukprot:scaffold27506_cov14-Tisochrysis_lutea.AAC.1
MSAIEGEEVGTWGSCPAGGVTPETPSAAARSAGASVTGVGGVHLHFGSGAPLVPHTHQSSSSGSSSASGRMFQGRASAL